MARTLDFSLLEPERSKFTDSPEFGSKEYTFEMMVDFGAVTQAQYNKANKLMRESNAKLEADPSDLEAAKGVENAMRLMMRVILPKFPTERIGALKVGQMVGIMNFWIEENGIKSSVQAVQKPVIEKSLAPEVRGAAQAGKK